MIDQALGRYSILEKIGEGGMGVVYCAHDSELKRDVALKVLRESINGDPMRIERFRREAQLLAALNHPGIASIYGIEEYGDSRALVMELVAGVTLSDQIARGPLALAEALPLAHQIAEALEYAHEHGIVHRDLKPANIKITPDGAVKLLDFGLAKIVASASLNGDEPTLSVHDSTGAGKVVGTAAYMSPEQARGQTVDKRTDVWAFGVVLFEMLTGRHAFGRPTPSDTIAAVLAHPPDWSALPAGTPPSIRRLLARCLEKDSKRRLHDIGDAKIEIEEVLSGASEEVSEGAKASRQALRKQPAVWAVLVFTAAALGRAMWLWRLPAPPHISVPLRPRPLRLRRIPSSRSDRSV